MPEFDVRRKKNSTDEGDSGFTGRDLTQTSHLNKLAALQARDELTSIAEDETVKIPQATMLAGSVTASVRKAWDIGGALSLACPETEGKNKTDIRGITHLHHALDAVTIGLAAYFFPKDGRLWELMSRRRLGNEADRKEFQRRARQPITFSEKGDWKITDLPPELKKQITERLAERRVVQHLPYTMRGLKVQQNTWRVLHADPNDPEKMVLGMSMRDADKKRQPKTAKEKKSKLLGLNPHQGTGKLARLKGSLIVEENFGVVLDPEIQVIPFMNVYQRLHELKEKNSGVLPRILRTGSVIRVQEGGYQGVWRISSIKDAKAGYLVDMLSPELVKAENKKAGCFMNARLASLIKGKLSVLDWDYTAHA